MEVYGRGTHWVWRCTPCAVHPENSERPRQGEAIAGLLNMRYSPEARFHGFF